MVVSSLTSSKYWNIGENHLNWTHLWPNSRLLQKHNEFIDVFKMVHQTSNCHIQAVMNNLKFFHNFRFLGCEASWDFGLTQRFLRLDHKQSVYLEGNTFQTSYQVQYTHEWCSTHVYATLINRLKPWCGSVPWALCSMRYVMPVCDIIIVSTISRMLRSVAAIVIIILKCLLVIVCTFVLCLKAAESFLETSQFT